MTDTVDMDDFGGSSTDGPGSSTGNVTGHMDMDNSGSSDTNGPGSSYSSLATFTTTSSETSASFVSTPSLTNRVPLLSPSDKSTGDVLGGHDLFVGHDKLIQQDRAGGDHGGGEVAIWSQGSCQCAGSTAG